MKALFIFFFSALFFIISARSDAIVVYPTIDDRGNMPYMFAVKNPTYTASVLASWYDYSLPDAPEYSRTHLTAASRIFPRGTQLIVSRGNSSVVVRVNDYGPEEWTGRDIDLSSYAFIQLAPLSLGILEVKIEKL